MQTTKISGTGFFVPETVVTNKDLEKIMDTSDEWIRQRTGIEERRHIRNGEGPVDLALPAAKTALDNAGLEADDLDLILFMTLSPDCGFPGSSALLQAKLGLKTTPAMDIRCQCSGFLYGLSVANAMIATGQYKNILIVGAEVHSTVLDMSTRGRDVSVLFGDGAGALILSASTEQEHPAMHTKLHAQGEFAEKLWLPKPGTRDGTWLHPEADHPEHSPAMDGKFVFKHAVTRMPQVLKQNLEAASLEIEDIDHFLFHQANLRINEFVAKSLKIPEEKVHNNIQKYGNCSAGSIPILLAENIDNGTIKRGDKLCMTGFGSGFTWGSAVLTY